jgi:hypothetical protein
MKTARPVCEFFWCSADGDGGYGMGGRDRDRDRDRDREGLTRFLFLFCFFPRWWELAGVVGSSSSSSIFQGENEMN